MADFYSNLKATAERLIREKGRTGTILRDGVNSGPAYAPVRGPDEELPIRMLELSNRKENVQSLRVDTEILQFDTLVMISTETGVEPKVGDRLLDSIGNVTYHIVAVGPLHPGPVTLLYKAAIRK